MLLELFLLSVILGFVLTWFSLPSSTDTVIIFSTDEELQEMCWSGLRNKNSE